MAADPERAPLIGGAEEGGPRRSRTLAVAAAAFGLASVAVMSLAAPAGAAGRVLTRRTADTEEFEAIADRITTSWKAGDMDTFNSVYGQNIVLVYDPADGFLAGDAVRQMFAKAKAAGAWANGKVWVVNALVHSGIGHVLFGFTCDDKAAPDRLYYRFEKFDGEWKATVALTASGAHPKMFAPRSVQPKWLAEKQAEASATWDRIPMAAYRDKFYTQDPVIVFNGPTMPNGAFQTAGGLVDILKQWAKLPGAAAGQVHFVYLDSYAESPTVMHEMGRSNKHSADLTWYCRWEKGPDGWKVAMELATLGL
eukprot:TRINITY_DN19918_c0_g1_i1.p1 TRINITY_DN19918_c0_g1~~TRINITY_DN19918_c0_g1_i1.p1  ORF type:complete len:309 (+),score=87.50 TRINITY_DN19918_c0_g1_i1:91-1017(+)